MIGISGDVLDSIGAAFAPAAEKPIGYGWRRRTGRSSTYEPSTAQFTPVVHIIEHLLSSLQPYAELGHERLEDENRSNHPWSLKPQRLTLRGQPAGTGRTLRQSTLGLASIEARPADALIAASGGDAVQAAGRDWSRFIGGERSAEDETSQLRAAGRFNTAVLFARLDTPCRDVGTDTRAKTNDSSDDRSCLRVVDFTNEGTIDLDLANGKRRK